MLFKKWWLYIKEKREPMCGGKAKVNCGDLWVVGFRGLIIFFLLSSSFQFLP